MNKQQKSLFVVFSNFGQKQVDRYLVCYGGTGRDKTGFTERFRLAVRAGEAICAETEKEGLTQNIELLSH